MFPKWACLWNLVQHLLGIFLIEDIFKVSVSLRSSITFIGDVSKMSASLKSSKYKLFREYSQSKWNIFQFDTITRMGTSECINM